MTSGWRNGYRIAFVIQLVIAILLFFALPLWKKQGENQENQEERVLVLSLKEIVLDGEIVEEYSSNITMSSNTATWQFKTDVIGEHILTIIV